MSGQGLRCTNCAKSTVLRGDDTLEALPSFGTADVSQLLNIPPGTVKSRLSRAKHKLSQLLNPHAGLLPATPLTPEEGTP